MGASDDDTYEIPLRDQRYFGAGLKRKRVQFIASTKPDSTPSAVTSTNSLGSTASESYLSIVFSKTRLESPITAPAVESGNSTDQAHLLPSQNATADNGAADSVTGICPVCRKMNRISVTDASQPHETSLAHQVCLPHAHPPSALDRRRKGFDMMQAYGWDPDQRLGLGAAGEGILHPIKAKEKRDLIGLGAETESEVRIKGRRKPETKKPRRSLDAGKIQKMAVESRKKDDRLREMFYRNDEVEKYLCGG